jgi:hypothetical protein
MAKAHPEAMERSIASWMRPMLWLKSATMGLIWQMATFIREFLSDGTLSPALGSKSIKPNTRLHQGNFPFYRRLASWEAAMVMPPQGSGDGAGTDRYLARNVNK